MKVDNAFEVCHDGTMDIDKYLIIKSMKYPGVFFRNEKAESWADKTIDKDGETCTEYVAKKSKDSDINYMIIHPEDDPGDVPFDYEGLVIQYSDEIDYKYIAN